MNSRSSAVATLAILTCLAAPRVHAAPQFADGRLIVKFRSRPNVTRGTAGPLRSGAVALDAIFRQYDVQAMEQLFPPMARNPQLQAQMGMDRFWVVQTGHPVDIPAAVSAFASLPDVEMAEPDYVMKGAGASATSLLPNDPSFYLQWGFQNTGSNGFAGLVLKAGADIKAVPAWDITTGDSSVLVAVLDSGLRMDHPEFAGRIWTNPGEIPGNSLDDDGNGYKDDVHGWDFVNLDGDPSDDLFHGTAVTSVIAANGNNGSLIAGLDWKCRIVPLKVVDYKNYGFYSWWEAGIYYAVSIGAKVINMSLVGYDLSSSLGSAMMFAHDNGCFVAAAMGNDDTIYASYPAAFHDWVCAVGGTDPEDHRCTPAVCGYGSNFGPNIDVVAPGQAAVLFYQDTGAVIGSGGTSFSTPMVSGLASLLLAVNHNLTPDQIRDVIRYSADDQVGPPEEDTPGYDLYYGYGRINCLRALNLVRTVAPPVVTAPASASTREGIPVAIEVSDSDPDGDAIQSLTADLSGLPQGHNAIFVSNADHTAGRLDWTPDFTHAGTYGVTFTASSPFHGSATTTIQVANVNDPPLLGAPTHLDAFEGLELVVDVSASDVDGDPITFLDVDPLPPGASFTQSADKTAGRLRWTPGFDQQGIHPLRFVARSTSTALTLTLQTSINSEIEVQDVDKLPNLALPQRVDGIEGVPLTVDATASDPDGDPLTGLDAGPLPPGAVFTASPDHSSGRLQWTPGFAQSGTYSVNVTATSEHAGEPGSTPISRGGRETVVLVIADTPDHPPVVTAPAQVTGTEGALLNVAIVLSDVDGDDILEASASPLPAGAAFTLGAGNSSAALAWTPNFDQAGLYTVVLSARSAHRPSPVSAPVPMDGFATMAITVMNTDRAPAVTVPETQTIPEGAELRFLVTAADPDGDPVAALEVGAMPVGATYAPDPGRAAGLFVWTPTYQDAGSYSVTFTASNALSASFTTRIIVTNVDRPPVANAGGPYLGSPGAPIAMDGSRSSDPDGDALTFLWDFGDGSTGSGAAPAHTYGSSSGSPYTVGLTVSDGLLSSTAASVVSVQGSFAAAVVFPLNLNYVFPQILSTRAWIEPTSAFDIHDIVASTVAMTYSAKSIVTGCKGGLATDINRNGIPDVGTCFARNDLKSLFASLPNGMTEVTVTVDGNLVSGANFEGTTKVRVVKLAFLREGSLASISPNPINPQARLTFVTTQPGVATAQVFDLTGRLVRTLMPQQDLGPGIHEVTLDGRNEQGNRLASGVYYYRVRSADGESKGTFVMLK